MRYCIPLYVFIIMSILLLPSCRPVSKQPSEVGSNSEEDEKYEPVVAPEVQSVILASGETIGTRYRPIKAYNRSDEIRNSFAEYLRNLPLKPIGTLVKYYNGTEKDNRNVYLGVVDLDIGKKNLHQCADAVMRLRAEYLWKEKNYNKIHFNFTNGFRVDYKEWMKGRRMVVEGNKTYWNDRTVASNTYENFWSYMELVFMYAGTASLEKEMLSIPISEAQIGDVLIQGGHPGHAVIIVDKIVNSLSGEARYILAQSYMPAQELQILRNNNADKITPWFSLEGDKIETPEWIFYGRDLRRFSKS